MTDQSHCRYQPPVHMNQVACEYRRKPDEPDPDEAIRDALTEDSPKATYKPKSQLKRPHEWHDEL